MAKDNYNNGFVAAFVLGSSKVTGIVGRKEPEGIINVLAYAATPSIDFVNKGRVFNVEKMISNLRVIRELLEEQVNCTLSQAYLAIDCMGIRSTLNTVAKTYNERLTISAEIQQQLLLTNNEGRPADRLFLETIPLEYQLGSITTTEPLGVMTDSVRANFLNIVCNSTAIETIENCFHKANIPLVRTTLAATQLAGVVTSEQERTSGCVYIDMGSETTTVAVYKGKLLRHLAVIPLGGANITRDIAKVFNCEEAEAEELKRQYGYPDFEKIEAQGGEQITLRDGGRARPLSELAEIIDARVEEIVQNIKHQVEISGYNRDNLVNGLYIIGGGAQLPDIDRAFNHHFENWNVRILKTPTRLSVKCLDRNFNDSGIYNVALALVENGTENCNGGERRLTEGDLFAPEEHRPETETSDNENEQNANETPAPTADPAAAPAEQQPHTPKGSNFWNKTMSWLKDIVREDD